MLDFPLLAIGLNAKICFSSHDHCNCFTVDSDSDVGSFETDSF